jgi:hypothetical protein
MAGHGYGFPGLAIDVQGVRARIRSRAFRDAELNRFFSCGAEGYPFATDFLIP